MGPWVVFHMNSSDYVVTFLSSREICRRRETMLTAYGTECLLDKMPKNIMLMGQNADMRKGLKYTCCCLFPANLYKFV